MPTDTRDVTHTVQHAPAIFRGVDESHAHASISFAVTVPYAKLFQSVDYGNLGYASFLFDDENAGDESARWEAACAAEAAVVRAALDTLRGCDLSCKHNLTWEQLAALDRLKDHSMDAAAIEAALEETRG